MKLLRQMSKPTAIILAFVMLTLSGSHHSIWAAMIDTESVMNVDGERNAHDYIIKLLLREDIRTALVLQGVDPQEAIARIETLSEAELSSVVDKVGQLPSGSGVAETLIIVVFLVFLVLLVTDIAGYTDVFPFVKKEDSSKSEREKTGTAIGSKKNIQSVVEDTETKSYKDLIIYFNRDSNELSEKAFKKLDGVADILLQDPHIQITLTGYADSTGTASYKQMLSDSRVMSVKTYLLGKGVDTPKIRTASHGTKKNSSDGITDKEIGLKKGVEINFIHY